MKVKLISITEAVPRDEAPRFITPENLIVFIARVSNPSNQNNVETSDKLLNYLIKNKHWSPFEMVDMTVEIVTSRAIAQQILRHRSFSFQEFSQRYAEAVDMEPIQLRKQAEKNRQSSEEEIDPLIKCVRVEGKASDAIKDYMMLGNQLYNVLLQAGVSKETARFVLPLTTQTRIYMKGSIRSWIHYLQIRCDSHVQLEHRQIADEIKKIFVEEFPNIGLALGW